MSKTTHTLLTGPPGVGKTTLVKKICEILQREGVIVRGFYTEEVRRQGHRTGFEIVTFGGSRGSLAKAVDDLSLEEKRQLLHNNPRVGKYVVDLASFEETSLPTLALPVPPKTVLVIDEIGKMEMFSKRFETAVRCIFDAPTQFMVLATVPIAKHAPLVKELIARQDVCMVKVDRENRDSLSINIAKAILSSCNT